MQSVQRIVERTSSGNHEAAIGKFKEKKLEDNFSPTECNQFRCPAKRNKENRDEKLSRPEKRDSRSIDIETLRNKVEALRQPEILSPEKNDSVPTEHAERHESQDEKISRPENQNSMPENAEILKQQVETLQPETFSHEPLESSVPPKKDDSVPEEYPKRQESQDAKISQPENQDSMPADEEISEDKVEALRRLEIISPGPLGPIPPRKNDFVPTEYWAPLADLTKTRPAVENFAVNRYSPAELRLYNDGLFKDSRESIQKERLAAFKAYRCMDRVFAQTDKDQQDNNTRLESRLSFIGRWKVELEQNIIEFASEIIAIQNERKRLLRCLQALKLIESIDEDMKSVRCLRMEHELVRDEVEDELSNEIDLCADIRNLYTRYVDQVSKQIKELKDAKQRVQMDLTDKEEAWNIDVSCRELNSKSETLEWKAGSVRMPGDQSTTTGYEHYCKEAIVMSQTALQRWRILRSNLHNTYDKCVKDLRVQADRVDMALSRKIDDTLQHCRQIENELNKCLKGLSDAEVLVTDTRAATKKLDGAMKCAQTRLDRRHRRVKVENCRDIPHFGLIDEAKTLSEGVTAMLSQMKQAEDTIEDLVKAREKLEKNLIIKRKSLWVDRDRCQLLRSFYPTVQVLAGH